MSKEAVSLSGIDFSGHTEHLAKLDDIATDEVTMLFLGPRLRTGLVTTHLSVRDVPAAISEKRIVRTAVPYGRSTTETRLREASLSRGSFSVS